MPEHDELEVTWDGDICHARLARPSCGNALSRSLVARLAELIEQCTGSGISTLILEGSGRHFCTGVDLSALDAETDDSLLARFVRIELLLQAVHNAPFDTVAMAHGKVAGAGADLFAACRHRYIDADTAFTFPGALGFGLVLGSRRLSAVVGADRANRWIASGCWISADEALQSGLAHGWRTAWTGPEDGRRLDAITRQGVRAATQPPLADELDLALLTRSAARPGIKQRIAAYAAATKARRTT